MYGIYIQTFFDTEEETDKTSGFMRMKGSGLITCKTYERASLLAKDFFRKPETGPLRPGEYRKRVFIPKRIPQ